MAADTAVWNSSLDVKEPDMGRAFVWHSETLARAGRYFNTARKGFSVTLKELQAHVRPNANPNHQPESNQPPANRQIGFTTVPPTANRPRTPQQATNCTEKPSLPDQPKTENQLAQPPDIPDAA